MAATDLTATALTVTVPLIATVMPATYHTSDGNSSDSYSIATVMPAAALTVYGPARCSNVVNQSPVSFSDGHYITSGNLCYIGSYTADRYTPGPVPIRPLNPCYLHNQALEIIMFLVCTIML